MITDSAGNGVPDPDNADQWLVPPWPARASFCEVLQHFGTRLGWLSPYWSTTQRLTFYEAYLHAMAVAPKHELVRADDWRWYEDLREHATACAETSRQRLTSEGRPAPLAGRHPDARPEERAS